MKPLVLLGLILCALAPPAGACPDLTGSWQSNRERTMEYLDQYVRMSEKQRAFVAAMMGRLVVRFDEQVATYRMEDWSTVIEGKAYDMKGFDATKSYEVLHCSEKVVVTLTRTLMSDQEQVVVYNFDDADTMWLYVGGADSEIPDSSFREYFSRKDELSPAVTPPGDASARR